MTSARPRKSIQKFAMIAVVIGAPAVLAGIWLVWLMRGPYYPLISQLHQGMSGDEVRGKLGEPWGQATGPVYRKQGAHTMLMVQFDQEGVSGWCLLEVPAGYGDGGYGNFKIEEIQQYPGPVTYHPDISINFDIRTKYVTGEPIGKQTP